MKKFNRTFIVVITLTIFVLMNTVNVFALQIFTDVSDGHWAKQYIEKMEKKEIVKGYDDATFRPSNNVSKLEVIVMIFRTLKAADKLGSNYNGYVNNHTSIITQYNIPTWAEESVAFALEKNIVHPDELKNFIQNGEYAKAKRSEVSVFLGKALNIFLKEDIKSKIYSFDFKDAEFITSGSAPYIDLLVRKKIIQGDNEGNFNPNDPIMRAAVAKMLSVTYDLIDDMQIIEEEKEEPKQEEKEEELTVKEGTIILIVEDNDTIIVKNEDDEKEIYKLKDEVEIVIDDRNRDIDDLDEDTTVKLYFDEDDRLVKVEVDDSVTSFEGKIRSIVDLGDYFLITVSDKDDSSRKKTFRINDDTIVKLNGERIEAKDLDTGDNISLEIEDGVATEIDAESKTRVYEGILQSGLVFDEYPKLIVRADDQEVYRLEVDEDAEVRKNNKKSSLTSLVKGDIVTLTTEYGKIEKIIATSIDHEDEGVITGITISNEPYITILNDNNEEKSYQIAPEVDIEIDDDDAELYDLKIDYRVELEIESDMVTEIKAESAEISDNITGIITEIYKDFDAIKIKFTKDKEIQYISISAEDADIITVNGSNRSFSHLDEGDEVFIYGKASNQIFDFVADKIIIIKSN